MGNGERSRQTGNGTRRKSEIPFEDSFSSEQIFAKRVEKDVWKTHGCAVYTKEPILSDERRVIGSSRELREHSTRGWTIALVRVMDRLPLPTDRIYETLIRVEWPNPTGKYRTASAP